LEDLQQLLGCDKLTVLKAFVKTPTLGTADTNNIAKRLQKLTAGESAHTCPAEIQGNGVNNV
jgi:hypothetical protein